MGVLETRFHGVFLRGEFRGVLLGGGNDRMPLREKLFRDLNDIRHEEECG